MFNNRMWPADNNGRNVERQPHVTHHHVHYDRQQSCSGKQTTFVNATQIPTFLHSRYAGNCQQPGIIDAPETCATPERFNVKYARRVPRVRFGQIKGVTHPLQARAHPIPNNSVMMHNRPTTNNCEPPCPCLPY